jgi:hypothetical protein
MRIRIIALSLVALSLVTAAAVYGQRRFSWQDYCFNHPASPACSGNDYAVKPPPRPAKNSPSVVTNPNSSTTRTATPSMIVVGAIDWRFADPSPDALIGLNFNGLAASPLARGLITQLGAKQGLTEADMQKIFDGLGDVEQVAASMRDNRMVVMITGRVTDSALPSPGPDLKAVPVSGSAMLLGHPDAVDQAVHRIAMKGPLSDLARAAEERQASSEFWAIGSPAFVGPQAVSAGLKRFSLTVSIRNSFTSDVAFEFNGVPNASTLQTWQTNLGATTLEGNTVHLRMSMEADEVQQKFGQIAASPVGERLAALVEAAKYLPVRDTTAPKQTKPVIYGLDDGPRVVNQYPSR